MVAFQFWETHLLRRHFQKFQRKRDLMLIHRAKVTKNLAYLQICELVFSSLCRRNRPGYEGLYEYSYRQAILKRCFRAMQTQSAAITAFKGKRVLSRYLLRPFRAWKGQFERETDIQNRLDWIKQKRD